VIVLNSNCTNVGGCGTGSPQETWLKADLAAHPAACTLAYYHHPRFSSIGDVSSVNQLWFDLVTGGADVVLNGHRHNYERFAPQGAGGIYDPVGGIREFVVGTGGKSLSKFGTTVETNSELRTDVTYGVLKLTLHASSYEWQFVPEAGKTFTDSGSTYCH
jgi:3',5'-cyclic AMP phosphodiesterase CpdA